MEYTVTITEELSRTITVKAKTPADADRKARAMYRESEIVLDTNDFVGVDFKVKED